jgi:hypothetical protein
MQVDFSKAVTRTLAQVALRQRLQPPRNAPEQVGLIRGFRCLAKQFQVTQIYRLGLLTAVVRSLSAALRS